MRPGAFGFDRVECVFVEQLKNFAGPGDLVMAISGSGNSPNVLRAVEYANSTGCRTLALTGRDGGALAGLMRPVDVELRVPATVTAASPSG